MRIGAPAARVRGQAAALAALLTLVAFAIGLTLPDVDLVLPLRHRSALTHSLLPALLLCARPAWRPVACGTAGGTGLHLAADVFPNAMTGFALVKMPLLGTLGAGWSYAWLAANAVAAVALAVLLGWRLHTAEWRWPVAAVGTGGGVFYLFVTDGGWPVLALVGGVIAAVTWWRRRRV